MLWYKAWLECRVRLAIGLFLIGSMGAMSWTMLGPETRAMSLGMDRWQQILLTMTGLVMPLNALILAGSGVNAQSHWGMNHGGHPSIFYTLSLPVTRMRLLWVRAAFGWLLTAGLVLTTFAVLLWLHGTVPGAIRRGLPAVPYLLIGTTLYYSFAVWLSSFLDEFWGGIVGLLGAGLLTGYRLADGPGWLNVPGFMEAQPLLSNGGYAIWQGLFYLLLSAGFLAATRWVIYRKEY